MDTRTAIFIILTLFAATAAASEPTPADGTCSVLTAGEAQVVAKTNEARIESGAHELVVDCRLMSSARRHARRMAREMALRHSSDRVAENVAAGQPTAADAVVVWLASPGHRANILNRGYRRVGVAGFVGPDGRAYWVQQFAP
jgi:uncharacterized protein YkwD